ncbi:MAG: CD1845 family protein [Clostridia bacterium]
MLKKMLRIPLLPVFFLIRLLLGIAAFIVSVSSAVIGLGTSVFVLLAMIEFLIGYWQNGLALLATSLLVSPIGLPALANWIIDRLASACAFIEGL